MQQANHHSTRTATPQPLRCIGLLGYGEVGRILAEDLRAQNLRVLAYDRKLDASAATATAAQAADAAPLQAHAQQHGVELLASAAALAQQADCIISAVTASQTVAAAQACAAGIGANAAAADTAEQATPFFLDFNSASPGSKQAAAAAIDAAGGRYVEGAVMTSVPPYRIRVPLLLGGRHAPALQVLLQPLGFAAQVTSERLGVASATKMCRSVMIKGLEAMVIESLTAARHYGVEDAVLASLQETFPGLDWQAQASYFFQRVIAHGRRRSEEMAESAHTVREAGLPAFSAQGTTERQAWMADLADSGIFGSRSAPDFARSSDWRTEADRLLAHLQATSPDLNTHNTPRSHNEHL